MIEITLPALFAVWLLLFGNLYNHMNWYSRLINAIRVKLRRKRFRPFDCVKCIAGWTSCLFCYYHNIETMLIPFYMVGAMVLATIFEKAYKGEL